MTRRNTQAEAAPAASVPEPTRHRAGSAAYRAFLAEQRAPKPDPDPAAAPAAESESDLSE